MPDTQRLQHPDTPQKTIKAPLRHSPFRQQPLHIDFAMLCGALIYLDDDHNLPA